MFCTQVKLLTRVHFAFYFYLIYMCFKCTLPYYIMMWMMWDGRWEMGDLGMYLGNLFSCIHLFVRLFVRSLVFLSYEVLFSSWLGLQA